MNQKTLLKAAKDYLKYREELRLDWIDKLGWFSLFVFISYLTIA